MAIYTKNISIMIRKLWQRIKKLTGPNNGPERVKLDHNGKLESFKFNGVRVDVKSNNKPLSETGVLIIYEVAVGHMTRKREEEAISRFYENIFKDVQWDEERCVDVVDGKYEFAYYKQMVIPNKDIKSGLQVKIHVF